VGCPTSNTVMHQWKAVSPELTDAQLSDLKFADRSLPLRDSRWVHVAPRKTWSCSVVHGGGLLWVCLSDVASSLRVCALMPVASPGWRCCGRLPCRQRIHAHAEAVLPSARVPWELRLAPKLHSLAAKLRQCLGRASDRALVNAVAMKKLVLKVDAGPRAERTAFASPHAPPDVSLPGVLLRRRRRAVLQSVTRSTVRLSIATPDWRHAGWMRRTVGEQTDVSRSINLLLLPRSGLRTG